MDHPTVKGIFAPVPTPFDDRGEFATRELAANLNHWGQFPLAGYIVLGSNGEAVHLDADETLAVLAAARQAIPTDRLMIVGTGHNSTRETVTRSRRGDGATHKRQRANGGTTTDSQMTIVDEPLPALLESRVVFRYPC